MAELRTSFGSRTQIDLIEGGGGAFEVTLDGATIYSKLATGEFPRLRDIPKLIEETNS